MTDTTETKVEELVYTTAKGLNVVDKGGLPFAVHLNNPDPSIFFALEKDGTQFGTLVMDIQLANDQSYGVTDAMLLAIVKQRYAKHAEQFPELQTLVQELDNCLHKVHGFEVVLVEAANEAAQAQPVDVAVESPDQPAMG